MMLTVRDLLNVESLEITCLAGIEGEHRTITWAHAVDLCDPWKWVAAGNLVMATGIGLPTLAAEQALWLEQLANTEACALLVAPRADSPALTPALLETADSLGFPLLTASFELAFVKVSQLVIESVLQSQRERLMASERLFQTYAQVLRKKPDLKGRLLILAETLGVGLVIEDSASGVPIVATQCLTSDTPLQRMQIPGTVPACLVIDPKGKKLWSDPLMLRSLVGLLSIELERVAIARDEQREAGAMLLRGLLANETELSLARPVLDRRGLSGTLVCVALAPGRGGVWQAEDIHHAPQLRHPAPLILADDGLLLMLVSDSPSFLHQLAHDLGVGTRLGISSPTSAAAGVAESIRQARLALAQAGELDKPMLRYGDADSNLTVTPKSLAEARALVGHYLSPLIEHDRSQDGDLMNTLSIFLGNNGNWKATAFHLGIHRQTLVYRIKRIEQLTGIAPTTTSGISRFWIALQAGVSSGLLPNSLSLPTQ